ncbi:MAG TPA: hypothetical protein VLT33_47880 [Labilithrix sp.]|nr:hypothetical protein [Labilithrix sp.]
METLGRLLDPEELDRRGGATGRLTVDVLEAWLESGDAVEIIVPQRLACARCEGGGCDACGRSGAFRVTVDEAARTLQLTLPVAGPGRSVVRLVRPFGAAAGVEQLWVELRASAQASPFCRQLPRAPAASPSLLTRPVWIALLVAFAVLLAVLLGARRALGE